MGNDKSVALLDIPTPFFSSKKMTTGFLNLISFTWTQQIFLLEINSETIIKNIKISQDYFQFYQPLIILQIHKEGPPVNQTESLFSHSYNINASLRLLSNKIAHITVNRNKLMTKKNPLVMTWKSRLMSWRPQSMMYI